MTGLWIQNIILHSSLTEGHYIEIYGNVEYDIGLKLVFPSQWRINPHIFLLHVFSSLFIYAIKQAMIPMSRYLNFLAIPMKDDKHIYWINAQP